MEVKSGLLNQRIPIIAINEEIFVQIGEEEFVSAFPIKIGFLSKFEMEMTVKRFQKQFGYPTNITTDEEWDKVIDYCNKNSCLFHFARANKLDKNVVVNVTNTNSEGIVFRAGENHYLSDKYFTATNLPQALFVTVRVKIPENP